jgi:hypothetical protein
MVNGRDETLIRARSEKKQRPRAGVNSSAVAGGESGVSRGAGGVVTAAAV